VFIKAHRLIVEYVQYCRLFLGRVLITLSSAMYKRDYSTAFAMMDSARAHEAHEAMAMSVEMNMREQFAEEVAPADKEMCEDEWDNPHLDDDEKARRRKIFAELRLPSVAQHNAQRFWSPEWSPETPEYRSSYPCGSLYDFGVEEELELYNPAVSAYDWSAPVHDPSAPQYQLPRPPAYSPPSAAYSPTSPAYSPHSPAYMPTSPVYFV
jgi:hypothetical protein